LRGHGRYATRRRWWLRPGRAVRLRYPRLLRITDQRDSSLQPAELDRGLGVVGSRPPSRPAQNARGDYKDPLLSGPSTSWLFQVRLRLPGALLGTPSGPLAREPAASDATCRTSWQRWHAPRSSQLPAAPQPRHTGCTSSLRPHARHVTG